MAQKTSINIKPCNVGSSGPHNRRTAEYLANIRKEKIYIRADLMAKNEAWVSPELGDTSLAERNRQIAAMVKEKTGRAMQTKDRERVNRKTGKVTIVRGGTPIKEGVVVIKEDTTMEQLRHFCEVCKQRWGITPLQVFIHRNEGHYAIPGDTATWKPNLHAHIVWDWMNHDTGKSCKLNVKDMSEMQTVLAECLAMERGTSKKLTGKEHLERTDFIIAKQKQEAGQAQAEKAAAQAERDAAVREADKAKAEQEKLQAGNEERQRRSAELDSEIADKEERARKADRRTANRLKWRDAVLYRLADALYRAGELFRKIIDAIIDFARSSFGGSSSHGDIFHDDEAAEIKEFMNEYAETREEMLAVGNWLVGYSGIKGRLSNQERSRAQKEVDDVAEGRYDWRIERGSKSIGR